MGSIENSLILMMIVQVVKSTNREFVQEEFSDDIDQPGGCVRNGECVVKRFADCCFCFCFKRSLRMMIDDQPCVRNGECVVKRLVDVTWPETIHTT